MAHTVVRCFFDQNGKLSRTIFCEDDSQLIHHQSEPGEVCRDIPHDLFKSRFLQIKTEDIEAYHAAQK